MAVTAWMDERAVEKREGEVERQQGRPAPMPVTEKALD